MKYIVKLESSNVQWTMYITSWNHIEFPRYIGQSAMYRQLVQIQQKCVYFIQLYLICIKNFIKVKNVYVNV